MIKDIKSQKKIIRDEVIIKRLKLSETEVDYKSRIICEKIICSQKYKESQTIYCYSSIKNEVDLSLLINKALNDKKIIALPKIINKNGKMIFIEIKDIDSLQKGTYNILEPPGITKAPPADLIIVPGTAFTKAGYRIGQAGGFYDRYLENNKAYTIGVCYDFQIYDKLPTEPHDIKINEIISDK